MKAVLAILIGTWALAVAAARAADPAIALLLAAEAGDLPTAQRLLAGGAPANARNPTNDWTPLIFAARRGDLGMAAVLIAAGAEVNAQSSTPTGSQVLHFAATSGQTNLAALLLAHGADLEKRNNRGSTALMEAAKQRDATALRWLLARGAAVNVRGDHGHTAFIYAAYHGHTEILRLLLQAGAAPPPGGGSLVGGLRWLGQRQQRAGADVGEPVLEIATLEELLHHGPDDGPPEAVAGLVKLVVIRLELRHEAVSQLMECRLLRLPLTIDAAGLLGPTGHARDHASRHRWRGRLP